jgi:hypothetical protein
MREPSGMGEQQLVRFYEAQKEHGVETQTAFSLLMPINIFRS